MANEIITAPTSPPAADADWDAVINSYTAGGKGQNALHLTNWDTGTSKPAIAAGSTIEINAGFAKFAAETVIDFSGASSGLCYIYIDVTTTSGSALPIALDTAPTWSDSKGGWYYSTGNNRATGHALTWDGSTSYSAKYKFPNDVNGLTYKHYAGSGLYVPGGIDANGELQGTSLDINGNADISGNLTGVDALTASGKITGAELEGTSLDINGNGDISGYLTVASLRVDGSGSSTYLTATAGNVYFPSGLIHVYSITPGSSTSRTCVIKHSSGNIIYSKTSTATTAQIITATLLSTGGNYYFNAGGYTVARAYYTRIA